MKLFSRTLLVLSALLSGCATSPEDHELAMALLRNMAANHRATQAQTVEVRRPPTTYVIRETLPGRYIVRPMY